MRGIQVVLALISLAAVLVILSSSAPIPAIRSIVSLWTSAGDVALKPDDEVDVDHAVVASDEGRCSAIGKGVLKAGGNAVDAAIASVFCLGVINPMASGIGGGAFMLIRLPNGSAEFIDSRETAPAASSQDMFYGHEQDITAGGLSVAVPGEVAGMHEAWKRHGTQPWASLVLPAARLARTGFPASEYMEHSLKQFEPMILSDAGLRAIFAPSGKTLTQGEPCVRTSLADTLEAIAKDGPTALYSGWRAAELARIVGERGGLMSVRDLESYKPVVREVLREKVFGLEFISAPPPSSGGLVIMQVLKMLAGYDLPFASSGPLGVHRMVEAMKHAFALRAHLGDPEFVDVAAVVRDMKSDAFAASLRATIDDSRTFPPRHYGHPASSSSPPRQLYAQVDDRGTSHTCVVDSWRMAVSVTSTVNGPWGAGILEPSTGVLLNNEMADFSLPDRPGRNRSIFEPPPAPSNFIRPGKRPMSSMAPTVILQNGILRAVVGGSGGSFIISSVLQVIINFFLRGMAPEVAVFQPRLHHQLLPNVLFYETNHTMDDGRVISTDNETVAALLRRGHSLTGMPFSGVVQLIVQDLEDPVPAGGEGDTTYGTGNGGDENGCGENGRKIWSMRPPVVSTGKVGQLATAATHDTSVRRALHAERDTAVTGPASLLEWMTLVVRRPHQVVSNSVDGKGGQRNAVCGKLLAVSDPRKDGRPAGF